MSNNISIVKLVSGEYFIGQLDKGSFASVEYTLNNVVQLYVDDNNGQPSVGIAPPSPYIDPTQKENSLTIGANAVAFTHEPSQPILDEYNRMFGNIIQPSKPSVLTE